MDEFELIKQQVKLLQKENDVMTKTVGIEFERIAKAFSQMGNLVDLVYLQVAVLIELLASKGTLTQEEFTAKLEETAKKVEEEMKKAAEAAKAEEAAKKEESKDNPTTEKL